MKLAILIINWNGKPLLNKCLNSISHQTIKSIPVYVVDNGSSDESIKFIQKNYPFVKIIPSKENLGFAQGNNLGISSIVEDYIFTLNNDTILDKYCIKNIIYEIKKNRDIGMFSLRMLRPSGEIDTLGIHLNYFGFSQI